MKTMLVMMMTALMAGSLALAADCPSKGCAAKKKEAKCTCTCTADKKDPACKCEKCKCPKKAEGAACCKKEGGGCCKKAEATK